MPYKLRKAPKKELYWVITIDTGKKHSKLPIPLDKAQAQMRVLEATLKGGVRLPRGMHNPSDEGDYDLEDEIERSLHPRRELQPRQLRHPLPNDEPDAPPKVVRHPRRDDEPEGPEGPPPAKMSRTSGKSGRGKKGGMLRNPLLVLNAEKEAKQIIQMQLTESDGAKGFANGKYSMEEILNRSIQSLIRSDKQEAVAYVQKLIAEYSSNPKYKVQTPEARQELAKAMGFTVGGKKPRNRILGRKLKGGVTAVQLRSIKNDVARLFPTLKTKYSLNPITGEITISAGPSEDVFGLFDASFQHWITPSEYAQIIKTSEYRNFRDFLQSRHVVDSIRIAQRIAGTVNFNDFDYFSNTLLELFRELRLAPVDSREQKLIQDKIINVYESFRHDMSFIAWKKLEELLIGPGVKVVNTSDGDYTYVSTPAPGRKEFLPYPLKRGIGKKGGMMPGAVTGNPKEGPTREIVNPISRRVLDPSVPRRVLDASAPRRIFVPKSESVPTVLETIKDCLDCKKSSSGKGKSKKCSKCGKFKV